MSLKSECASATEYWGSNLSCIKNNKTSLNVLAAAVCTKSGTIVVSRHFVEISRSRIEGLLASFPRLVNSGQQHTFVETDTVRYVYQPLDELYLVLVTNRSSNILQDIDTLHLFARAIPEYCKTNEEKEIRKYAFELIFAFDEIVQLGYRENLSMPQLKTLLEMESQDEKVQEALAKIKEREAKEAAKLKMKQIEIQRKEMMKKGAMPGMGGMGSNTSYVKPSYEAPRFERVTPPTETSTPITSNAPGRGMKLGRKEKSSDFMESLKTETGLEVITKEDDALISPKSATDRKSASIHSATISPKGPIEPLVITVEEKITVVTHRDGGVENMEVKGELNVRIDETVKVPLKIGVEMTNDKSFQFKTNPIVDKKSFLNDSILTFKDPNRAIPVGQAVGLLKWRFVSQEEEAVPLLINCWPSSSSSNCDINIEYELVNTDLVFKNVVITIPIPSNKAPVINEIYGDYYYDKQHHFIEWRVPTIDSSNSNASLEFSIPEAVDTEGFYPVHATFESDTLLGKVNVKDVLSSDGNSLEFAKVVSLSAEDYSVV